MSNTERNIFSNVIFLCTTKDLILNSLVSKDQRYFISDKVKVFSDKVLCDVTSIA